VIDETTEDVWQRNYYQANDLVVQELKQRFDQPGMKVSAQRERLIIDAASKSLTADDMDVPVLPANIDRRRLGVQLSMLHDLCTDNPVEAVHDVAAIMKMLQPETRRVFTEVEQLISLCLSLPVSVAGSERSFSALRRLKTWLRSVMTQRRLTNLALMHMHADIIDSLDLQILVREFISQTPERGSIFGSI
jgi:hypothetical protein